MHGRKKIYALTRHATHSLQGMLEHKNDQTQDIKLVPDKENK